MEATLTITISGDATPADRLRFRRVCAALVDAPAWMADDETARPVERASAKPDRPPTPDAAGPAPVSERRGGGRPPATPNGTRADQVVELLRAEGTPMTVASLRVALGNVSKPCANSAIQKAAKEGRIEKAAWGLWRLAAVPPAPKPNGPLDHGPHRIERKDSGEWKCTKCLLWKPTPDDFPAKCV